jgi:uncharacterized protein (DUF2235 family)
MRHLIVCCDGTWQTPGNRKNVHRLSEALAATDVNGDRQERQYFPGVGVAGSLWSRIAGGVAGTGLSQRVMEALPLDGDPVPGG